MKRKIELTHEQIDLLINCLWMASSDYNKQFEEMNIKFPQEERETKQYWFNKSNKIYDLAQDIKNGEFDV